MVEFCGKPLPNRSKYAAVAQKVCHKLKDHSGKCDEFPFLRDLSKSHKRVADKIKRDSTMTTGAAWKSDDAGPNRILRWVMLLSDEELFDYGLDMSELRSGVVAKLREKAATYEDCIHVAIKLTWLTYQMSKAPNPSSELYYYLETVLEPLQIETTVCEVCRLPLSFDMFERAKRGKALIETCHKDPRYHNAENIGFAHRECNIAQGAKSLDEFYKWIDGILRRVKSYNSGSGVLNV